MATDRGICCPACGSGLAPEARFCRRCGAATESTAPGAVGVQDEAATTSLAVSSPESLGESHHPSCPACAAAVTPGATFCRTCGDRLTDQDPVAATQPGRPAGAPGSAAPPAPQREMYAEASTRSGGRGRSIAVAATLACLVLGALVGGVAYLLTKDDSQARADLEAGFAGGDGMPNDAADGGASSASGPSSDAPSGGQLEPEGAQGPNGLAVGRYLQAGSFRTAEAVQQEVERVRDEGIKAFVWPSERTNELLPGFQVVLIGPLAGVREERRLTRWLDGIGIVALGRDLTPSATLSGPSDVAGAWAGEFERSRLRGSRRPSSEQIVFAIDPDGRSGTVEYPERGCEGSLALVEAGSHSVTYRESIDSGACPDGWIWHLRPAGSELKATGLHDERQVMLHGTVPRG